MSHQPFETWLLDQQPLALDDLRALQAHLDGCLQCRKLQSQWQMVHQELYLHHMVAPAPGFSQRWREGLAIRRTRQQRKQAWKVVGLFAAVAMVVLLVAVIYTLAVTSPTDWLIAFIGVVSTTTGFINLGIHFIKDWLSSTPLALNLVLWIYLTVSICLLVFAWGFIIWRTNHGGVLNQ